jgi:hypothetical protein
MNSHAGGDPNPEAEAALALGPHLEPRGPQPPAPHHL